MSKRSDKMYKDSPRIETDADGKKVMTRGKKEAARTDDGTEGMTLHESHAMEMHHKHAKERLELHQKHEKEHHELHAKHAIAEKEHAVVHAEKHEGGKEEKKEEHAEKKTDQEKGAK